MWPVKTQAGSKARRRRKPCTTGAWPNVPPTPQSAAEWWQQLRQGPLTRRRTRRWRRPMRRRRHSRRPPSQSSQQTRPRQRRDERSRSQVRTSSKPKPSRPAPTSLNSRHKPGTARLPTERLSDPSPRSLPDPSSVHPPGGWFDREAGRSNRLMQLVAGVVVDLCREFVELLAVPGRSTLLELERSELLDLDQESPRGGVQLPIGRAHAPKYSPSA